MSDERPTGIRIEVVRGVEGLALYVGGLRVKGPKPWAGGESVASFLVKSSDLEAALWPRPHESGNCWCGTFHRRKRPVRRAP